MSRLSRFIHFFTDEEESAPSELPDGYKKVLGFAFDAGTYYVIEGLKLKGSDTVRISIKATAACNVFGCYTNTSAEDNYSMYVSTAANAKYLRYNGGVYKSMWNNEALSTRYDIVITPTGSHGMPEGQDDTWEEASFTSSTDMCIGTTATGATSSKFRGEMYGSFVVDGKFNGIPCERESDGVLGYYDTYSETFYEPTGSAPTSLGYA